MTRRMKRHELLAAAALLLAACGGGGGGGATSPTPPPAPDPAPSPAPSLPAQGRLSADTPVAAGCGSDSAAGGTLYANAEVEPWVALQPGNPNAITAAWQQDRWSNGAARAVLRVASQDGGASWQRTLHPFSRCGGGNAGNGRCRRLCRRMNAASQATAASSRPTPSARADAVRLLELCGWSMRLSVPGPA